VEERVDIGPCVAELYRRHAPSRVLVLPGALYTVQAPLLWYVREVALASGAGVLAVLDEMPAEGDPFEWAQDRARRALEFDTAERCVVAGKSLASAAAGLVADRALPALWLTPLLDQPAVVEGLLRSTAPTMLVGGTDDPTWSPEVLGPAGSIEIVELAGLDHSLQVPGDVRASLKALGEAVSAVECFLSATLAEAGVDNQ
jgi:hypothetical protein